MLVLRLCAALAAYWDTLGWVYFQKGDLESAEKYIKAAWVLEHRSDVGHHMGMVAEKRGKRDEAIRLYAQGAVATRVEPEARESLLKLITPDSIDARLETARKELLAKDVFTLGQLVADIKAPVEAEFYLIFAPDSSHNAQVIDVKFIKGAESLKPFAAQLKAIKYPLIFPDNSPTKVIRRGTLLCTPNAGGCTYSMVSPNQITSVD